MRASRLERKLLAQKAIFSLRVPLHCLRALMVLLRVYCGILGFRAQEGLYRHNTSSKGNLIVT